MSAFLIQNTVGATYHSQLLKEVIEEHLPFTIALAINITRKKESYQRLLYSDVDPFH